MQAIQGSCFDKALCIWGRVRRRKTFDVCFRLPPQPVDATFYRKRKDGLYADEAKISSRICGGGENGAVGSLAARGVAKVDRIEQSKLRILSTLRSLHSAGSYGILL